VSKDYFRHYPVFYREFISLIESKIDTSRPFKFLDCTFGGGGHSMLIHDRFAHADIIGIDQDLDVINHFRDHHQKNFDRIQLKHGNFSSIELSEPSFDVVLIDCGVSTHQLMSPERGFSFMREGPIDMRMNANQDTSARDILNSYSEEDLEKIIREYGEERNAKRIAQRIIETRDIEPIETTKDLENIVFHAYPQKFRYQKIHPATKTFQAIRIEVNKELDVLQNGILSLSKILSPNGFMAIISFHSLEDRIVKHRFKELVKEYPDQFTLEFKRPLLPSKEEILENSRSRSAKLRVLNSI
jgi:16S rRNA (cytosine1402-N4)-methyltransferase